MDAVVLGVAIAVMVVAGVSSLLRPEMPPMAERALVVAVGFCVGGGGALLWVHERWWMLAALQGVMYVATAPFTGRMPLRVWTAICAVNFTAFVWMGWPA